MIELEETIYCPKCKREMIFWENQQNPGPNRNLGSYHCRRGGLAAWFPDGCKSCSYDDIWTIDGVQYTDEEVERYKRLRAFI